MRRAPMRSPDETISGSPSNAGPSLRRKAPKAGSTIAATITGGSGCVRNYEQQCDADILNQTLLDRPTESFQVSQIALHAGNAVSRVIIDDEMRDQGADSHGVGTGNGSVVQIPGTGLSGNSAQCNTSFVEAIGGGCGRLFLLGTRQTAPFIRSRRVLRVLVRDLRTAASGHGR